MKTPKQVELTKQQEKDWEMTRAALLWSCPAFSHIMYTMLDNSGSKHIAYFTDEVPIAATDGSNLLLNPNTFFKYTLKQRVFICAHEIMHCVWDHCGLMHRFLRTGKVPYSDGTTLPYSQELMNVATDLVINDALIESNVGEFSKDWLHDRNLAVSTDSAIDAYRKIFKQSKSGKSPANGSGFDEHLAPGTSQGKDPASAASQRNEAEWRTQVAAGINAAKAQGKLPAGLERLFSDILEPKVDWKDKIAAMFARKVGSGSYDWRRADRRLIVRDIYSPGRSGFGAGTVVVAIDTSGSIGETELSMFFAEMSGILEDVRPRRLLVMWCDAKVHRVDEVEEVMDLPGLRAKGAPGGGGTAFEPVFEEISKMGIEPEALVYLTDGLGSFPKDAPSYPTIWGNIYEGSKYPFGEVVDIPKAA